MFDGNFVASIGANALISAIVCNCLSVCCLVSTTR